MGKSNFSQITSRADYLQILKRGRRYHLNDWLLVIALEKNRELDKAMRKSKTESFFQKEDSVNLKNSNFSDSLSGNQNNEVNIRAINTNLFCESPRVGAVFNLNTVNLVSTSSAKRPGKLYVFKQGYVELRFGITASRKVGNAVIRNRLKRLVRTFFEKLSQSYSVNKSCNPNIVRCVDINVIFKPKNIQFYKKLDYQELEKFLMSWVEKL